MNRDIIACLVVLAVVAVPYAWVVFSELRDWNDGCCSRCGARWRYYGTDIRGGRGYTCPCSRYIWISYPGIDKEAANG